MELAPPTLLPTGWHAPTTPPVSPVLGRVSRPAATHSAEPMERPA
jgi:hypothetical protein